MNRIRFPRSSHLRPRAAGVRVASCLLALLLPSVAPAANLYPVRHGVVDELYGKTDKDFSVAIARPKERQFAPFGEQTPGDHPDVLSGSACYDEAGFTVFFISRGRRAESVPECGGSVSLYLREGMKNTATDGVPVSVRYDMRAFPKPEPGKPYFASSGESSVTRSEPTRFSSDCPSYGSVAVRQPPRPTTRFYVLDDGWGLSFSFRWVDFRDRLPFRENERPVSWRMVATRVRPDGSATSWGTLAEPVILSWAPAGDSFLDELAKGYFVSAGVGPIYRDHAEVARSFWTTHRTEKWIGYLDPGIPTFEPKNPDSDAIFFARCIEPFLDGNDNIDKAIYFNFRENIAQPRALTMTRAEREAIVAGLDRIIYVNEMIDTLRRDYLLDRFLNRPVAQRVVPQAARPKKLKPIDRNRILSADELSLDGVGAGENAGELDDVAF